MSDPIRFDSLRNRPQIDPQPSPSKPKADEHAKKQPALSDAYMSGNKYAAVPCDAKAIARVFNELAGKDIGGNANAKLDGPHVSGPMPKTKVATAPPAPGPGKTYTTNPNEVPTAATHVSMKELEDAVGRIWPEATPEARRIIAAQVAGETGFGKSLYNNNLGNKKAGPSEPHMYLRGTFEDITPAQAAAEKAGPNGHLVRIGDTLPNGNVRVFFDPPHPQARFRANATLEDGLKAHVAYHQGLAAKDPMYAAALMKGDTDGVAHGLKARGYYSASEESYKALLKSTYHALETAK